MLFMLSLHIVALLIWSAALLYFPLLFTQNAANWDVNEQKRLALMQRALYAYVMTPSGLVTIAAGMWLIFARGFSGGWLHVKLSLVLLMVFFHIYCGVLMASFHHPQAKQAPRRPPHGAWFYRALPLAPAILITAVVALVTGKPF